MVRPTDLAHPSDYKDDMVKVTWQRLKRLRWPMDEWPYSVARSFHIWSERHGGKSKMDRYFIGNTALEVAEKYS